MSVQIESTARQALQPMALRCTVAAWDCQVYSFYGSRQTVAENLASLPSDLLQRRVYLLAVQGPDRAEVRLFERGTAEDSEGTVAVWEGESLDGLVGRIADTLIANRGVHCPGEQVSAVVYDGRELSTQGPIPIPVSARAAFGHSVKTFGTEDFIQASVIVLC
jgi:hypothetical protein